MSIGENIKRIRKEKGITQKALAEKLHVDPSMISQWETTREPAKLETIERIASALGVSAYDLIVSEKAKSIEGILDSVDWNTTNINDLFIHIGELAKVGINGNDEALLISDFRRLNNNGKKQALNNIHDLTLIDKYTNKD